MEFVCFNSQRDGILHFFVGFDKPVFEFQFPTGWNSTRNHYRKRKHQRVSIPNGMEFYRKRWDKECEKRKFQFPTGWNSTRWFWKILKNMLVSIPNGMEFYHRSSAIAAPKIAVSIPNGMEFYAAVLADSGEHIAFQFPTGWNSTVSFEDEAINRAGFNSQRDGILPTPFASVWLV